MQAADDFFFLFSSYLQPPSFYLFNEAKKESRLFYKSFLYLNEKDFVSEIKWYKSKDGIKVPLFLLYKKGISLDVKDSAVKKLAAIGFDPQFGARPMARVIQEQIENTMAKKMIEGKYKRGDKVVIGENDIGVVEK